MGYRASILSFYICLFLGFIYKPSNCYFFFFLLVTGLLDWGTTVSSLGGLGVKLEDGAYPGSLITVMSTSSSCFLVSSSLKVFSLTQEANPGRYLYLLILQSRNHFYAVFGVK